MKNKIKIENALVPFTDAGRRILAMKAEQVAAEIDRLIGSINGSKLRLALLLRRVQVEQLYKVWEYTSFRAFIEDRLRLNFKTTQALVRIERVLIEEVGIERADVCELGFARALELVPLASEGKITAQNRDAVVAEAKKRNGKELEDYIRAQRSPDVKEEGKSKNDDVQKAGAKKAESVISQFTEARNHGQDVAQEPEFTKGFDILESCMPYKANGITRMSLAFRIEEQVMIVRRALEMAEGVFGKRDPSDLLVQICGEFICKHDGSEAGQDMGSQKHTLDLANKTPSATGQKVLHNPIFPAAVVSDGLDDERPLRPRQKRVEANTAPSTASPMEKTARRRKSPDLPDAK